MNAIQLIGRLCADPEMRVTQSDIAHCQFTLAVDRGYKNKDGERETDFLNCVSWRKTAETIANTLTKGRRIAVEGTLQSRKYETKEGQKRTVYEVVVHRFDYLDRKPVDASNINAAAPQDNGGERDLPF